MTMRELHVSDAEMFVRCPEEYHLRRVLGVAEPGYAPALAQGRAMHAAGAGLREGRNVDAALTLAARELDASGASALGVEAAAVETAKVAVMVNGYAERWATEPVRHCVNEIAMEAPLINPATGHCSRSFVLAGRVDGLILDGGAWSLYEMKTTSDTLNETESYLREGIQIPVYDELALRARGIELQTNVVDIIKKPVIKRRKGEPVAQWAQRCLDDYRARPDWFFRRVEIPVEEARIRWAMSMMWRIAEQIRESHRRGFVALRGWSCCKKAYGWCRFKSLCWYGDDINKDGEESHDDSNDATTEHAA